VTTAIYSPIKRFSPDVFEGTEIPTLLVVDNPEQVVDER